MSDISFTGLGSGIDTASMIDALMSVEKRPIERLETKPVTYTHLTLPTIYSV